MPRNLIDIDTEITTSLAGRPAPQPKRTGMSAAAQAYLTQLAQPKSLPKAPSATKAPVSQPPATAKTLHKEEEEEKVVLSLSDLSTPTPTPRDVRHTRPPIPAAKAVTAPPKAQPRAPLLKQTAKPAAPPSPKAQLSLSGSSDYADPVGAGKSQASQPLRSPAELSLSSISDGPVVALHSLSSLDLVEEAASLRSAEELSSVEDVVEEVVEAQPDSDSAPIEDIPPVKPSPPTSYEEDFQEDSSSQDTTSSAEQSSSSALLTPVPAPPSPSASSASKTSQQSSSESSEARSRSTQSSSSSSSAQRSPVRLLNRGTQTEGKAEEEVAVAEPLVEPLPSLVRLMSLDLASAASELAHPQKSLLHSLARKQIELVEASASGQWSLLSSLWAELESVPARSPALSSEQILLRFQEIDQEDSI